MFTAKEQGEYRFCFNNEMSTFAEKMVDFEIAVCAIHGSSSLGVELLVPLNKACSAVLHVGSLLAIDSSEQQLI